MQSVVVLPCFNRKRLTVFQFLCGMTPFEYSTGDAVTRRDSFKSRDSIRARRVFGSIRFLAVYLHIRKEGFEETRDRKRSRRGVRASGKLPRWYPLCRRFSPAGDSSRHRQRWMIPYDGSRAVMNVLFVWRSVPAKLCAVILLDGYETTE